jgi:hypothetical protein
VGGDNGGQEGVAGKVRVCECEGLQVYINIEQGQGTKRGRKGGAKKKNVEGDDGKETFDRKAEASCHM